MLDLDATVPVGTAAVDAAAAGAAERDFRATRRFDIGARALQDAVIEGAAISARAGDRDVATGGADPGAFIFHPNTKTESSRSVPSGACDVDLGSAGGSDLGSAVEGEPPVITTAAAAH